MSQTDGKTDDQLNSTDFIGPISKDGGSVMFFGNSRIKFLKLFGLIVSHMERINARKRNTINIVQGSKSSKIMICSKIIIVGIGVSTPTPPLPSFLPSPSLNQQTVRAPLFRQSPAKIYDNIFQNKEKFLFWGHYCPKGIFLKNSGYVQL